MFLNDSALYPFLGMKMAVSLTLGVSWIVFSIDNVI